MGRAGEGGEHQRTFVSGPISAPPVAIASCRGTARVIMHSHPPLSPHRHSKRLGLGPFSLRTRSPCQVPARPAAVHPSSRDCRQPGRPRLTIARPAARLPPFSLQSHPSELRDGHHWTVGGLRSEGPGRAFTPNVSPHLRSGPLAPRHPSQRLLRGLFFDPPPPPLRHPIASHLRFVRLRSFNGTRMVSSAANVGHAPPRQVRS